MLTINNQGLGKIQWRANTSKLPLKNFLKLAAVIRNCTDSLNWSMI